jgi:integral membrane protein
MPARPKLKDVPRIRGALKLYRVTSIITGTFLLLLVLMMITRYGFGVDIGFGGNYGGFFLLAKDLIEDAGAVNISTIILILHGWFYVLYLFSDFRLWSAMRWSFARFILIAAGGVVPFLSFIVERHYHRVATAEVDALEAASLEAAH